MKEYSYGASQELYEVTLHEKFINKSFSQAIHEIYEETGGCLLIGLHRPHQALHFQLLGNSYGNIEYEDKGIKENYF